MTMTRETSRGGDRKTSVGMTFEFNNKVVAVHADGWARVMQRIERVKMERAAPDSARLVIDTRESGQPKTRQEEVIARFFASFLGLEYGMTMDPRGQVIDFEVPKNMKDVMAKMPDSEAWMSEQFSEAGFRDLSGAEFLPTFPSAAPVKGAAWTGRPKTQQHSYGALSLTTRYVYVGPELRAGRSNGSAPFSGSRSPVIRNCQLPSRSNSTPANKRSCSTGNWGRSSRYAGKSSAGSWPSRSSSESQRPSRCGYSAANRDRTDSQVTQSVAVSFPSNAPIQSPPRKQCPGRGGSIRERARTDLPRLAREAR